MKIIRTMALAAAGSLALAGAAAAETYNLRIATWVTPLHGMSKWIDAWAADMTEKSGGRLQFEILHGAQMGPPPRYYDIARNGQADITWVLHGATPGRFELTEVSNMPFLFCSAEQASTVLNDPRIRSAYLDEEHRGVKVLALFMHPPGQVHMREGEVRRIEDLRGKAMRPASAAVAKLIGALGGQPVGMPPTEMAEGLQKGTLDGTFIDFGGAGIAFQLGPHLNSSLEIGAYAASFGLVMNTDTFAKLPADLQELIDASFEGRGAEIGKVWDDVDVAGRTALENAGVNIFRMDPAEEERFRAVGAGVTDAYVAEIDGKGKPASDVLAMLRNIAEEVGPVGFGCR